MIPAAFWPQLGIARSEAPCCASAHFYLSNPLRSLVAWRSRTSCHDSLLALKMLDSLNEVVEASANFCWRLVVVQN